MTSHPKALPFLFLTEFWERFGFYVMQGLLVLYMTKYFGFSDDESYTISGIWTGLVYISPFVGGFLADKLIGFKTAIIWGGLFLTLGYGIMALSDSKLFFYLALATIIVGNGLFKPNISSLLGTQYAENDPRRDSGFTIFYIGINIGAALSGISGYIRDSYGWHITYGLACIGMVIGLLTFLSGLKYINHKQNINRASTRLKYEIFFCCLLAIVGASFVLKIHGLANLILPATGILLLCFLAYLTVQQEEIYRKRMIALNVLILSSIVFWMLFLQLFYSANLFVDRLVDKTLFGLHLTTTVFYASESIFIITLGPLFALMWEALGRKNKNPSPAVKFMFGIFFAGLGFLVLSVCTYFPDSAGLINPLWVFFSYLLITVGELLLSPIGLSAVTTLAPPHLVGMMMGVWFVATGFGGIFAGLIAKLSSVPASAQTTVQKLAIYHAAFLDYACLAFVVAIILFFVQTGMRKVLRG